MNTNQKNKVKSIVEEVEFAMMATISDEGKMRARPMATKRYDEQGNIWFFSKRDSEKVDELCNRDSILLTYSKVADHTYLSLSGKMETVDNLDLKKELFSDRSAKAFPEGPSSENLALLKFTPSRGEYWDSEECEEVQQFGSEVRADRGATTDQFPKADPANMNEDNRAVLADINGPATK